jgi:hypothetical protein
MSGASEKSSGCLNSRGSKPYAANAASNPASHHLCSGGARVIVLAGLVWAGRSLRGRPDSRNLKLTHTPGLGRLSSDLSSCAMPSRRTSTVSRVGRRTASVSNQIRKRVRPLPHDLLGSEGTDGHVGLCYRDGVNASSRRAREWLQRAACRGHAPAREALTGML